jgi:ubiquinone/menaquinone biosynthesis C-methylase UbiE
MQDELLPFESNSFDSSYVQYVLHHLQTSSQMVKLLAEALRISTRVVLIEEIKGSKTDVVRAELFDKKVNDKIHPNVDMPVYGYCTSKGIESLAAELNAELLFHRRISDGEEGNGFLEMHVFVISSSSKRA